MAEINVTEGSFGKGLGAVYSDYMSIPAKVSTKGHEKIKLSTIKSVKTLKMEEKRRWGRAAALGATGGVLFGPVGLVGGALLGGNKTVVKFEVVLKDGKKFKATADSIIFQKFLKYAK